MSNGISRRPMKPKVTMMGASWTIMLINPTRRRPISTIRKELAALSLENPIEQHKNSAVNISMNLVGGAGNALWRKMIGPSWITVDSATGNVGGVTNDIGEAHYIQVKAISGGATDSMTFILVVGSRAIHLMDGLGGNPTTIQEAYGDMASGDVLIIPDGEYTGPENTINGNISAGRIVSSGTPGNYTTIIARNPNEVNLPSIYSKRFEIAIHDM